MSTANKELVARLHTEVLDTGDLAPIDELIHPAYLNHEAAPGTPAGRDGFRHTVDFLRGGFPDLRFAIDDMVAEHWACRDDISGFRQLGTQPRSA
jgi:predicted ester cyclase